MAFKINEEECIGCGACAGQCPVDAIQQNGDKYAIDTDTCAECGACAAQCPVEAIAEV